MSFRGSPRLGSCFVAVVSLSQSWAFSPFFLPSSFIRNFHGLYFVSLLGTTPNPTVSPLGLNDGAQ